MSQYYSTFFLNGKEIKIKKIKIRYREIPTKKN